LSIPMIAGSVKRALVGAPAGLSIVKLNILK
jgi:hypothetical protein